MAPVIAALMTESETAFLHTCLLSCRILLQMLLHPYYSIHLASILLDFIEICSLKGENIDFFNTRDRKKRCIQLSRHGFRDDSEDLLQELKRFWSSSLACLLKKCREEFYTDFSFQSDQQKIQRLNSLTRREILRGGNAIEYALHIG